MTKNRKQLYAILAVVAVLFTVIAFAAPFKINAVFIISYLCGLTALGLQIPFFKAAFEDKESLKSKVLGFPVFRVGYIYLGIQLVLSLILMLLSSTIAAFPTWIAVILCAIVLCGALVCGMSADIARNAVERVEQSSAVDTTFMNDMRSRTAVFVSRESDSENKAVLQRLAENFRYADPVSSEGTANADHALEQAVAMLEAAVIAGEDITKHCAEVQTALDERNTVAKMSKRR